MPASDPNLAALSAEDRQLVESWLVDFDQAWNEDRLKDWLGRLPPRGDCLRRAAVVEMVKIDLERRWQEGKGARLESYLKHLPELGTPETVGVDLILAEYEARRQAGRPKALSEFTKRFPHQADELCRLVEQAAGMDSGAKLAQSTPHSMSADVPTSFPVPSAVPAGSLPEQFGRYRILKELGKGGMGAVFLAHDTQIERDVALKVPKFIATADSEVLQRFYREAKAAGNLGHPNICPVYDVGEINGVHYLTMEYVKGQPLSDLVAPGQTPMPQARAAEIVHKLALALKEAHARGVIHRDLKPSNIMINQRQEPILMDFGLARRIDAMEEHLTKTGEPIGTPAYMPPEQVCGDLRAMGPGSDIYSLGVILYQLLTHRIPFGGPTFIELANQIMTDQPEPPHTYRADVDQQLEAVCSKAMAKKVEQRFASMDQMAAALQDYLGNSSRSREKAPSGNPTPVSTEPRSDRAPEVEDNRTFGTLQPLSGPRQRPRQMAREQARSPASRRRMPLWLLGIAAGFAAIFLAGIVILIRTGDGWIKIELSDPKGDGKVADVKVDVDDVDHTVTITGLEQPLRLKSGDHKLVVTGKDFETVCESFTVRRWGNPVVRVTLVPKKAQQEWVQLFNGKDLTGWVVESGNARQWDVQTHEIIAKSRDWKTQTWVLTEKDYSDYTLRLEFSVDEGTSSGVAIRATPGEKQDPTGVTIHPMIKLTDQARWPKEPLGTTHWVSSGERFINPQQPADLHPGWNRMEIEVKGEALRVSVNGRVIIDTKLAAAPGAGLITPGLNRQKGRVGLQAHTGTVHFRNVEIKELPAVRPAVPLQQDGFVTLFNGKDLTGWKPHPSQPGGWRVVNGVLVGSGPAISHLYTERDDYKDFHLRVEARINNGGQSNVYFRAPFSPWRPAKDPTWHFGYATVIDSTDPIANKTGSLFVVGDSSSSRVRERESPVSPGEWFTLEVIAEENHFTIWVNGTRTVSHSDEKRLFASGHIALQQWDPGHIALQHWDPRTRAEFRKIEIKELPSGRR